MKKISKKTKLLNLLTRNKNKRVSVWNIIQVVKTAHHTSLIKLLRDEGYVIDNQIIYEGNTTYSSYRLIVAEETILEKFKKLFTKQG